MHFAFADKSRNEKTGNIPVSTSDAKTCPDSCGLKASGVCYAKHGPLGMLWAKVNANAKTPKGNSYAIGWADLLAKVAALPEGQLWRHNQAGDLPGENNAIDGWALGELVEANKGKRGFTYTHKPVTGDHWKNRELVASANKDGFTINLSADTLKDADRLAALAIAPVVVVVSRDAENHSTPEGRKVVICPAQTRDDVSCKTCGLCAVANRQAIIGFRAHGVSAKRAEAIALA
jgi:hypothetical protein